MKIYTNKNGIKMEVKTRSNNFSALKLPRNRHFICTSNIKGVCGLCGKCNLISVHHLEPKGTIYPADRTKIVELCKNCHELIHALFSNEELILDYNSLKKIRKNENVKKYLGTYYGEELELVLFPR